MATTAPYSDFFFLRFKEGDELAFEYVFKSDFNIIVGFCQQFVKDSDIAQSLAQESFVKLWLNRSKIETANGIRSFLYTSAKTECLNYIRHLKVINNYQDKQLQALENNINKEVLESFDFDAMQYSELERLIEKSIEELPERCKLVFKMSRLDGKKNEEIAKSLSISIKSVEANMTRAIKLLKSKLSEYLPAILIHQIFQNF